MKTALLFGATGLVGGLLLRELAADPGYQRITVVARRPPAVSDHPRVVVVLADFTSLESVRDQLVGDEVYIALGTTHAKTPDRAEYARIDRDYPVLAARLARANGARWAGVVTAVGADAGSRFFYTRTKGEAEQGLAALDYPSLDVFRPGVLLGDRGERRPLERLAVALGPALNALLPGSASKYRAIQARTVARAMHAAARERRPGMALHHWREMQSFAGPG